KTRPKRLPAKPPPDGVEIKNVKGSITMRLHQFVNEVMDMAKANRVEYAIAIRMFTGNVMQAAGQGDYVNPGLENFDFAPLAPHVQELLDTSEGFVKDFEAHK